MATATATKQPKSLPIEAMLSELKSDEYVVVDIETTGLSPAKGGYLIEVAAVRIENGKITDTFSELIDPQVKLYGKTIEITGITNEMVHGQRTYGEVLPELFAFMGDAVIVAHNAQFDWNRFLLHYFSQLGYYPLNQAVCTKRLFQQLEPQRRLTKEGYGLSQLVVHYDVAFDEAGHHRALADTVATAEAFIKMRNIAFERDLVSTDADSLFKVKVKPKREKEKVENVTIQTVSYWEKTFGTRTMKRVYVKFEDDMKQFGNVFYDVTSHTWFVKDFWRPIDLGSVETLVLEKVKAKSMKEYLNSLRG